MVMNIRNLPNEILERIRQYIGNCRIWKGELIKTIDKNSDEFKMIEETMKSNCWLGRFRANLHMTKNWAYTRFWCDTNPAPTYTWGHQWRSIEKHYNEKTDTLTFTYQRKKIKWKKKKDPLKKNMDVTIVIN